MDNELLFHMHGCRNWIGSIDLFLGSKGTWLQEGNKVIIYWHQMSNILHMLMLRLRHMLLKLDHLRLFFTITTRDDVMSSQR